MDLEQELAIAHNEAMRRPVGMPYLIARLVFAYFSYQWFAGGDPEWLVNAWMVFFGLKLGKDLIFGMAPMQGLLSFIVGTVSWLLWIAMVITGW